MKNNDLVTNLNKPQELVTISKSVGLRISEEYGTFKLSVDPDNGTGEIRCINFGDHFTILDCNLSLKRNIEVQLKSNKKKPLYFLYCQEGECYLPMDDSNNQLIEKSKTAILKSKKAESRNLILTRCENLRLNILVVDQDSYFENIMNGYYQEDIKIEKVLNAFNEIDTYHIGSYNLKISEQLRALNAENKVGQVANFLFQEGIYHLILAYHIEQFYNTTQRITRHTNLNQSELTIINSISEAIVKNPEVQHNIDALCRQAGMSPAKLQEGFKYMHGLTVLNYIRSVRLNKAESLLLNSELNISEIVYSIGFTSRSYFCKIFRNKYNCTPKEYRKTMKSEILKSVA